MWNNLFSNHLGKGGKMRKLIWSLIMAGLLLSVVPVDNVFAYDEPLGLYENWNEKVIDSNRWLIGRNDNAFDVRREIEGNRLIMRTRALGVKQTSPVILSPSVNRLHFPNPRDITAMEVDFRVHSLHLTNCDSQVIPAPPPPNGRIRAAVIDLVPFNDLATPTPGSQVGNYLMRVQVNREDNSTDREGVMTGEAWLFRCADTICASVSNVGINWDLGKVKLHEKFTLRIIWEKEKSRFIVGLNDTNAYMTYNVANVSNPVDPFASIRTMMIPVSCPDVRTEADSEVHVLKVRTNVSAIRD